MNNPVKLPTEPNFRHRSDESSPEAFRTRTSFLIPMLKPNQTWHYSCVLGRQRGWFLGSVRSRKKPSNKTSQNKTTLDVHTPSELKISPWGLFWEISPPRLGFYTGVVFRDHRRVFLGGRCLFFLCFGQNIKVPGPKPCALSCARQSSFHEFSADSGAFSVENGSK